MSNHTITPHERDAMSAALPKLRRDLKHFGRNLEARRNGPYADRSYERDGIQAMEATHAALSATIATIDRLVNCGSC